MTEAELKEEAKKLGFYLLKPSQSARYKKVLPCTCGCKRRSFVYNDKNEVALRCTKCEKQSAFRKRVTWARESWNEMILKERE